MQHDYITILCLLLIKLKIKFITSQRDDRRRATHNEVERRRRDKINNWITKLGKIIPECNAGTTTNGSGNSGEGKANYETQVKFRLCVFQYREHFQHLSLVICIIKNTLFHDRVKEAFWQRLANT